MYSTVFKEISMEAISLTIKVSRLKSNYKDFI